MQSSRICVQHCDFSIDFNHLLNVLIDRVCTSQAQNTYSNPRLVRDNKNPIRKNRSLLGRGGEMVDTADLKSSVLTDVWVRIPPSVPTEYMFNLGI